MITRYKTKQIFVGNITVGGDAPISIQSMTFSKTRDIKNTIKQIRRLEAVGCDIVRVAVPDYEDARALKDIKSQVKIPVVADIHFNYKLALIAAEVVDCIRINPGNIGSKTRMREVAAKCNERNIPIRIGVNCGSLESIFEDKYGNTAKGMVESALYNIKYLEDLGFTNIKISLKASDVLRTVEAYRALRPKVEYPFHVGVTEAGTLFNSTIKSSVAVGALLLDGIGDTIRVSITGELEEEIRVAKTILKSCGLIKNGVNIISCPTCGRIQADLVGAIAEIERKTAHIKTPLNISVMGCAVNAIGEAKGADVAIAYGKGSGLIIKKGEIIAKLSEQELVKRFLQEVEEEAKRIEETNG